MSGNVVAAGTKKLPDQPTNGGAFRGSGSVLVCINAVRGTSSASISWALHVLKFPGPFHCSSSIDDD